MSINTTPARAHIVAATSSLPERRYTQTELADTICGFLQHHQLEFSNDVVRSLFTNVQIEGRHFEFDVENFCTPPRVSTTAATAVEACVRHGERTARSVLSQAGLSPKDIGMICSVTLTPSVPSVEARLMNRIAFSPSTVRLPLAGLGCMAGVAGINRATDYLQAHPTQAALLLSCELSSALWQGSVQGDLLRMIEGLPHAPELHAEIIMSIVTAALFGDGAGALLMVGREHPLAERAVVSILDTRSNWIPDTEHIMGLDYIDEGMRNILRPEVKSFVGVGLRDVVEPMLQTHQLNVNDVQHWTLHPGGPKIMDAAEAAFKLSPELMQPSRNALREVGNISSATVLYMLDRIFQSSRPLSCSTGLIVAMGPGFSQEATLVRWN
jgi:alkylresorcinol/alkylpyrone synthase